jgi:hypothetical protein
MNKIGNIVLIFFVFTSNVSFAQNVKRNTNPENIHIDENLKIQNALVHQDSLLAAEDFLNINYDTLCLALHTNELFVKHFIDNENLAFLDSTSENLYQKGYQDGRLFYINKGAFWGAFAVGFLTPYTYVIPGLATGILMASIPPGQNNLRFHDKRMLYQYPGLYLEETHELFDDAGYSLGYQKGAHKRKFGSVAGGMGAGVGAGLAIAVIMISSILAAWP